MNVVKMPRADWDTVIAVLTLAQELRAVGYIDGIIKDIDDQIARQEY
jgi:hypothetical protein